VQIRNQLPKSVRLSILGVGTVQGATIPMSEQAVIVDDQGNSIIARLNEEQLKKLARDMGGVYSPLVADNSDVDRLSRATTRAFRSSKVI